MLQAPPTDTVIGFGRRNRASTLPLELLETIFLNLLVRTSKSNDDLIICSLVCSWWTRPAQRILFMEVDLFTEWKARKFLRAIESNSMLSRSTKLLSLRFHDKTFSEAVAIDSFQLIKRIVAQCPHLYFLKLLLRPFVSRENLMELADHPNLSNLRALSLYVPMKRIVDAESVGVSAVHFFEFLRKFPSILHLKLEWIQDLLGPLDDLEVYSQTNPFQLYEFRVNYTTISAFIHFTNWLMGGTPTSSYLRVFELTHAMIYDTLLHQFLKPHASTLVSLCLGFQDEWLQSFDFAGVCPSLKDLRLLENFITKELRERIPTARLEHLAFSDEGEKQEDTEMIGVTQWIMGLPKIRSVDFYVECEARKVQEDCYAEFWQGCRRKGIKVTLFDLLAAEDLVSDDFIKSEHFPRGRTIENFSHMGISASS